MLAGLLDPEPMGATRTSELIFSEPSEPQGDQSLSVVPTQRSFRK